MQKTIARVAVFTNGLVALLLSGGAGSRIT